LLLLFLLLFLADVVRLFAWLHVCHFADKHKIQLQLETAAKTKTKVALQAKEKKKLKLGTNRPTRATATANIQLPFRVALKSRFLNVFSTCNYFVPPSFKVSEIWCGN